MIKRTLFALAILGFAFLTACNHSVTPEKLKGNWKYIKIDHPKGDDQSDTTNAADLAAQDAHITFEGNNQLIIHWGGKILSHGTYVLNGDNINYTEQLDSGKTRNFPFYVSKLDDKNIVFETVGATGSRVTAVKN